MERKMRIYKLHFNSPLHLSDNRSDYGVSRKTMDSDTMYAAMTAVLAKVGDTIPENGDLGCTISSLFPFYQKEKGSKHMLLFPKPLKLQLPKLSDFSKAKGVKKIQWLDQTYFNRALKGENIISSDTDVEKIDGIFLLADKKGFNSKFIKSNVVERVTIESRTFDDDAQPFYMDRVEFADYSGLYFIAEGETTLVEKALDILSLEGIGTDRNIGNGFFEWESDEVTLSMPDNSNCMLSLSSYIPDNKEELTEMIADDKVIAYEFQRRGGWITSYPNQTLRKNVIYLFDSGSVFSCHADSHVVKGKIVDLRPEIDAVKHPVWRCGKAIMIPIKI